MQLYSLVEEAGARVKPSAGLGKPATKLWVAWSSSGSSPFTACAVSPPPPPDNNNNDDDDYCSIIIHAELSLSDHNPLSRHGGQILLLPHHLLSQVNYALHYRLHICYGH